LSLAILLQVVESAVVEEPISSRAVSNHGVQLASLNVSEDDFERRRNTLSWARKGSLGSLRRPTFS
jgi:hypothetical protein